MSAMTYYRTVTILRESTSKLVLSQTHHIAHRKEVAKFPLIGIAENLRQRV